MPHQTSPELRALAHPVRLRMLTLMWTAPMSAAELARELGISHALASQHLRKLAETGFAELAEVRNHRGGRERRYRTRRGTPLSDQSAEDSGALLVEIMVAALRDRLPERVPGRRGHTTDAELYVPPEVWQDVRERVAAAMLDLHDAALAPRSPGTARVSATVMLFEMRQPEPRPGPGSSP